MGPKELYLGNSRCHDQDGAYNTELYLGNRVTVRVSGTPGRVLSNYYREECTGMARVQGIPCRSDIPGQKTEACITRLQGAW